MAQVPLVNVPQVAPQGPPANDYQRIDATPAAFGGAVGGAEQKFGAQAHGESGDLTRAALLLQERHNQLAATDAFNSFQSGLLSLTGGDPNVPGDKGYFGTTGRTAMDGYQSASQKIGALRDQIKGGLQNDLQRLEFDEASRRLQTYTLDSMRSHYLQQSQVYALGLNRATEENQQRAVAVQPDNETAFNNSVPEVYRAAIRGAQDRYGDNPDPAIIQAEVGRATTGLVRARIQAWAPSEPGAALDWLQNGQLPGLNGAMVPIRTAIEPAAYEELYRSLHSQSTRAAGAALAASVWIGGGAGAVADAVKGQEASAPGSVSPKGARGAWQIQPATFQQYAQPGESIDNPVDNEAVGRRIVNDYSQRYAGDPSRVAVAYFSGPNNVAPAGSPTPWVRDSSDGRTSVSSYVSGVLARLGSAVPTGKAPTYPDTSAGVQKIIDATSGDPELQQAALSAYERKVRVYELQTATERRDIQKSYADAVAALETGKSDVTIPEARIRAVFDPVTADDMIGKLTTAKYVGQIFSGIQWASPEDVAAARDDLASGLGTRSALLRAAGKSAALPVQSDGAVPALSVPIGTTGQRETPEQFRMRQQVLERFDQLISARSAELRTDPAAYVSSAPTVAPKIAALDPKNTASFEDYAGSTLAAQEHLGVPEPARHVLTAMQANATVQKLTTTSPAETDVGQLLDQTAKQYGTAWPKVFGDLVTLAKLPPEYQMLAAIPDPSVRGDFQRVLSTAAEKGGVEHLKEAAGQQASRDIDQALDGDVTLAAFRRTAAVPGLTSNTDLIAMVRNSVRDLALLYATHGQDGAEAVRNAADGILGRYDFDGTARLPKGMADAAHAATADLLANLKPSDLMPLAADTQATAAGPGLTEAQRQDVTLRAARRGTWVANEDESGLVLVTQDAAGRMVVMRRANGARVELPFAAMKAAPAGQSPSVPVPAVP
jgi:hypothetical protein